MLLNRIRNAMDIRWRHLTKRDTIPIYFYIISNHNRGWGVVVPEILGVLKHAKEHGYRPCFISKEASHTATIRFFDIGQDILVWDRDQFIHEAGLETLSATLSQPAGEKNFLLSNLAHLEEIRPLLDQCHDYNWPFADLLRFLGHATEYVHPDFGLERSSYSEFARITLKGLVAGNSPITLARHYQDVARSLLVDDKEPRFVLSIRQAPPHHGSDRNTSPEELDQTLATLTRFTKSIYLIGSSPRDALCKVIRRYSSQVKIYDCTFSAYEAHTFEQDIDAGQSRHLLQSYLLSTPNIKLLPQNGLVTIPSASGQMHGIYGAPYIFNPHQKDVLVIPQRYSFAPELSPIKAFIYGLSTMPEGEWIFGRIPCKRDVLHAGIENLMAHHSSASGSYMLDHSVFNNTLLPVVRRNLCYASQIRKHLNQIDFGTHFIQDSSGLPLRYA